jgi:hypothetical protein
MYQSVYDNGVGSDLHPLLFQGFFYLARLLIVNR